MAMGCECSLLGSRVVGGVDKWVVTGSLGENQTMRLPRNPHRGSAAALRLIFTARFTIFGISWHGPRLQSAIDRDSAVSGLPIFRSPRVINLRPSRKLKMLNSYAQHLSVRYREQRGRTTAVLAKNQSCPFVTFRLSGFRSGEDDFHRQPDKPFSCLTKLVTHLSRRLELSS